MSQAANSIINGGIAGGFVPVKNRHLRRFPFLFLVDVSGSTGVGNPPDIDKINEAVPELLAALRKPPAGSELAMQVDSIDVCLVTYSDTPQLVIDWCVATSLQTSVRPFVPWMAQPLAGRWNLPSTSSVSSIGTTVPRISMPMGRPISFTSLTEPRQTWRSALPAGTKSLRNSQF